MNNNFNIIQSNTLKLLKLKESNSKITDDYNLNKMDTEFLKSKYTPAIESFITKNKLFRIILPSKSLGTFNDAKIYKSILPYSTIVNGYDIEEQEKYLYLDKYYINIYIELPPSYIIKIKNYFPSVKRWLMINQEMIQYQQINNKYILHKVYNIFDIILCKTRYAFDILNHYKENNKSYRFIPIYTGFTSICNLTKNILQEKNYNLIVHFAGKSPHKNTDIIIKSWIENKGFVHLNPKIQLIITCFDKEDMNKSCYKIHLKEWSKNNIIKKNGYEYLKNLPNLLVYTQSIDNIETIIKKAGCFLCPSSIEGYGHYINEGKCNGGIVITTNAPPMNELIRRNYGLLIKYEQELEIKNYKKHGASWGLPGSSAFTITQKHLTKTIIKYIKIPLDKKKLMSKKAYKSFKSNLFEFEDRMVQLYSMKILNYSKSFTSIYPPMLDFSQYCTNNPQNKNIINSGAEGIIYAIKQKYVVKILKSSKIQKYKDDKILILMDKINKYIELSKCPNFIYNYFFCEHNNKLQIYYPLYHGNLYNLFDNKLTFSDLKNIIMQLSLGVYIMNKKFGVMHYDLHELNIFYYKLHKTNNWKYKYFDTFNLHTIKYLCVIADIGGTIRKMGLNRESTIFPIKYHKNFDIYYVLSVILYQSIIYYMKSIKYLKDFTYNKDYIHNSVISFYESHLKIILQKKDNENDYINIIKILLKVMGKFPILKYNIIENINELSSRGIKEIIRKLYKYINTDSNTDSNINNSISLSEIEYDYIFRLK